MKSLEIKQQFIELRATNESFSAIAEKLRVSKPTLIGWSKELEKEIRQAKAIELDALQKQYWISKQHRVTVLGKRLQKVREELDKRDMSALSTDRLLELEKQFTDRLSAEEELLVFETEPEEAVIEPVKFTKTWTA